MAAHAEDTHAAGHGHQEGEFAHPASLTMLFSVFIALLLLTGLTVYQSTFDFGNLEIVLSLFIATIKAGLVILFFMHMLWDKLMNVIFFFGSLIFVSLFLGFTLMDATSYHSTVINADTLQDSIPKISEPVSQAE